MREFPTDPMRQHDRFIDAFCADLRAGDKDTPRAKAVCEIFRQMESTREREAGNRLPANQ